MKIRLSAEEFLFAARKVYDLNYILGKPRTAGAFEDKVAEIIKNKLQSASNLDVANLKFNKIGDVVAASLAKATDENKAFDIFSESLSNLSLDDIKTPAAALSAIQGLAKSVGKSLSDVKPIPAIKEPSPKEDKAESSAISRATGFGRSLLEFITGSDKGYQEDLKKLRSGTDAEKRVVSPNRIGNVLISAAKDVMSGASESDVDESIQDYLEYLIRNKKDFRLPTRSGKPGAENINSAISIAVKNFRLFVVKFRSKPVFRQHKSLLDEYAYYVWLRNCAKANKFPQGMQPWSWEAKSKKDERLKKVTYELMKEGVTDPDEILETIGIDVNNTAVEPTDRPVSYRLISHDELGVKSEESGDFEGGLARHNPANVTDPRADEILSGFHKLMNSYGDASFQDQRALEIMQRHISEIPSILDRSERFLFETAMDTDLFFLHPGVIYNDENKKALIERMEKAGLDKDVEAYKKPKSSWLSKTRDSINKKIRKYIDDNLSDEEIEIIKSSWLGDVDTHKDVLVGKHQTDLDAFRKQMDIDKRSIDVDLAVEHLLDVPSSQIDKKLNDFLISKGYARGAVTGVGDYAYYLWRITCAENGEYPPGSEPWPVSTKDPILLNKLYSTLKNKYKNINLIEILEEIGFDQNDSSTVPNREEIDRKASELVAPHNTKFKELKEKILKKYEQVKDEPDEFKGSTARRVETIGYKEKYGNLLYIELTRNLTRKEKNEKDELARKMRGNGVQSETIDNLPPIPKKLGIEDDLAYVKFMVETKNHYIPELDALEAHLEDKCALRLDGDLEAAKSIKPRRPPNINVIKLLQTEAKSLGPMDYGPKAPKPLGGKSTKKTENQPTKPSDTESKGKVEDLQDLEDLEDDEGVIDLEDSKVSDEAINNAMEALFKRGKGIKDSKFTPPDVFDDYISTLKALAAGGNPKGYRGKDHFNLLSNKHFQELVDRLEAYVPKWKTASSMLRNIAFKMSFNYGW